MAQNKRASILLLMLALKVQPAFAELSLEEVLTQAIKHHPVLQAHQYAELSQQQNEKIAQSSYYPKLSAMSLVTKGFPGSAAATGVEGLMGSPFHKGLSAGLVLEQTLLDFGRTREFVQLAEKETEWLKKDSIVSGMKVGQTTQKVYFVCSQDRSLSEAYRQVVTESELIQKEINNLVRVGQRSIVDHYLAQSQTEASRTLADDYQKRFQVDNQLLGYLIGNKSAEPLCPILDEQAILNLKTASNLSISPLLSREEAQVGVSQAQISLAQKDFYPKLVGFVSSGWTSGTELGVRRQNYSAAIGLIFPLFEGFKTVSQVKKWQFQLIQNEKSLVATRFEIDEANFHFDRLIESARLRIHHLKQEINLAESGFRTAKKRYFDLQGSLLDLREAFQNWTRTSVEFKVALYDLATQSTAKALLNGQWNLVIHSYQNHPLP